MLDGLAGLAGDAAQGGFEAMLTWLAGVVVSGAMLTLDWLGTWWLQIGSPDMGPDSAAARIQDVTRPLLPLFGVMGTALGLVRFARDPGRDTTMSLVAAMIRTVVTVAIILTATSTLLEAGTVLSPWLVNQIGQTEGQVVSSIIGGDSLTESVKGDVALAFIVMILAIFALIASLVNGILVLFSYGVAAIIAGLLAFFAAMSTTETGEKSFNKLLAWLVAVVLFKPVAAVIWGFGLAMAGSYQTSSGDGMDHLVGLMCGLVMICAAIMALPAIARAVAPMTASGPRGMGGASALNTVGALATGAVLVGASAALGVAGAAGATGAAGSGSAGATGAAGSGSAGAAGASGSAGGPASGPAGGPASGPAGGPASEPAGGPASEPAGGGAESQGKDAKGLGTSGESGPLSGAESTDNAAPGKAGGDAGIRQGGDAGAPAAGAPEGSNGESAAADTSPANGPGTAAGLGGEGQPTGSTADGGADDGFPTQGPAATGSLGDTSGPGGTSESFVTRAVRDARRDAMYSARSGLQRTTDDFTQSTESGEQ